MAYLALGCVALAFLTPFYVIYKPPALFIRYLAWRNPEVLYHVSLPATKKMVAISFDDAPSSYTPDIAAALKANDAHATFFVIGSQVQGHAEVLSELVKEGHELANHAMYDEPSRYLSSAELQKQISKVEQSIQDAHTIVGKERPSTKWFRPGSGFFTQRMIEVVEMMGLHIALGDIYPHDPQVSYVWVNARHVLSMVKPGGIIINHDRRPWTAPMLKKVLPELKRRGYEVVTVSQLVAEKHKGLDADPVTTTSKHEGQQGPASQSKDE